MSSNPYNLVYLTHEFAPRRGGIASYVEGMARASAKLSIPTEVWTYGREQASDAEFPFPVERFLTQGNQNWSDRLKLARGIRSHSHDWSKTILCLPEPGPLRMYLYLSVLGLPRPAVTVPILHGSEIGLLQKWPHRRRLFDRFLQNADRIGVVSQYVRGLLLQEDSHLEKIDLVPGAPLQTQSTIDFNNEIRQGPMRLLCLGRIQKRKG